MYTIVVGQIFQKRFQMSIEYYLNIVYIIILLLKLYRKYNFHAERNFMQDADLKFEPSKLPFKYGLAMYL